MILRRGGRSGIMSPVMAKRNKHRQHARSGVASVGRPSGTHPSPVVTADPASEVRRGLSAFERGEYGVAIQAWTQARRAGAPEAVDRAIAEAHFRRALAAPSDGRRAQELHEAVALAPDHAVYQYHLALAYHRQGQVRRAIEAYEAACRLDPANDRYRRHLTLARCSDPGAEAQPEALPVVSPPGDESFARLAALAALRQNRPLDAVVTLVGLESPSPLAKLALGLAHLAADQPASAASCFTGVLDGDDSPPSDLRAGAQIATVAASRRDNDLDAALQALRVADVPANSALQSALGAAARALGRELLLEERLDEAVVAWQRALVVDPRHEATRRVVSQVEEVLGTRDARAGEYAEAARHWEAALAEQPGEARILQNLALAAERLEQWEQASARWEELIAHWKRAMRGSRRDHEAGADLRRKLTIAHRRLADAYDAADDLPSAVRAIDRALNFDPSDMDLRLRAAELSLEDQAYGPAIDHLRRVLAVRPDDVRALIDLGAAYDLKGDERQAESTLERALAIEPGNQAAMGALAAVFHSRSDRLVDAGQLDQAVAAMERAIELEPGAVRHHQCLGASYVRHGQLKLAEKAFARAIALDPDDVRTRVEIGAVYLASGYEKDAQRLFRQALKVQPGSVTHVAIGLAHLRLGRSDAAHQQFKHLLKENDALSLRLLGAALNDLRREVDAERYLKRAVELEPSNARGHLDLAWSYAFGLHNYPEAAREVAEARRLALEADDAAVLAEAEVAAQGIANLVEEAEARRNDPYLSLPGAFLR